VQAVVKWAYQEQIKLEIKNLEVSFYILNNYVVGKKCCDFDDFNFNLKHIF